MLNPLISCTVYGFEMLIVYIFFSRISTRRCSAWKCIGVGLVLFELGSGINLLFHNNVFINTLVSIGIKIVFTSVCFEMRWISRACYAIVLDALNFALEIGSILFLSALAGANAGEVNRNLPLLAMAAFVCKTLLLLTCLILSNIINPKANFTKAPLLLFYYPLSVAACMSAFWYICAQDSITYKVQLLLAVCSAIIFGATLLQFITYQQQIEENSEYIRLKSEYDKLQTEKSYYDILERQNQNLMLYAHDAKNHLAAIQARNRDPAIASYIAKMTDQLNTYSKSCRSGNLMLDVMIGKYVLDCERRGISFDYNVRSCNLKKMEDMDLVAVLGNLMDNAVTAAEQSARKQISLETTIRNGFDIVILSNSCAAPPNTCSGTLITSKEDRKLHGFGLKSVKKVLRKYHGDFEWTYDERAGIFTVTVMIAQPSKLRPGKAQIQT